MSKDVFRLTSPSGTESELPVYSGTVGPDVIDIGKQFTEHVLRTRPCRINVGII